MEVAFAEFAARPFSLSHQADSAFMADDAEAHRAHPDCGMNHAAMVVSNLHRNRVPKEIRRHGHRSTSRSHVGISEPQREASLVGDDLLERLAKIQLEVRPFRPTEMGRAENVRH
jgi:hypothetical protein